MEPQEIKIFEAEGREHSWFQDLLEDEQIPFRVEYEPYWAGSYKEPLYREKQCFYVSSVYQDLLQDKIEAYLNLENLAQEDLEWMEQQPNEMPQVVCPACGRAYDLDMPKCPFCKYKRQETEHYLR